MRATTEPDRAAELARRLRDLIVTIEGVEVAIDALEVPSYPDEPRPTSIVAVAGEGRRGLGEHVGWTSTAHRDFAKHAPGVLPVGRTRVGTIEEILRKAIHDPYSRAAIEAATIDLALRQAEHSLASLTGNRAAPTRYVVSFGLGQNAAQNVEETLRGSTIGAKVDVDPAWKDSAYSALAQTGRVAVLDWKRTGGPSQFETALRALPDALQEDPGPEPCYGTPAIAARRSLDGPILLTTSLHALPRPAAVNLKPARMGGVLEALDAAAVCARNRISFYFGGMFELGPGRRQLLALASLLAPNGPNDIAPIPRTTGSLVWPDRLSLHEAHGYGDFSG